ncbi:MAG: maleylpyruvate isomerase family mycothiol-dependent enzyme [Streptosporangiaceae bacterium]
MTANAPAEPAPARDPHRPARVLQAERDALLPILQRTQERAFDRPTACPGWSVRDVLAHCAAVFSRVATGNLNAFTPALNEIDVAERREWPLADVLSELTAGYQEAGPVIAAAGGRLDVIALGEWLHGGDVRDALGEPLAYASDGFDDACALLGDWTRRRAVPLVEARLSGRADTFGVAQPDRAPATLVTSRPTLMRLFAGRPADASDYQLTGATPAELVVF